MKFLSRAFMAFTLILATVAGSASTAEAKVVCRDGQCYIVPDEADGANASPVDADALLAEMKGLSGGATEVAPAVERKPPRVAFGYMDADALLAFLRDEPSAGGMAASFEGRSLAIVLLLAFFGGLALNLTPCVLPMIPVSLAVIGCGKGVSRAEGLLRGTAYGAGIALAYGVLGAAVAFGFTQFGALQSSPWFGIAAGLVFFVMGLAMMDLVNVDFSRLRGKLRLSPPKAGGRRGTGGVFLMGVITALAAGACVAPAVVAVCAYAASGGPLATCAPFAMGLGMAAPWPLLGAGVSALPRPGMWMVRLKQAMALALAAYGIVWAVRSVRDLVGAPGVVKSVGVAELAAARDGERPVFVKFGAPWCGSCAHMERTTMRHDKVVEALRDFTALRVEISDPAELRPYEKLLGVKITGLPACFVLE